MMSLLEPKGKKEKGKRKHMTEPKNKGKYEKGNTAAKKTYAQKQKEQQEQKKQKKRSYDGEESQKQRPAKKARVEEPGLKKNKPEFVAKAPTPTHQPTNTFRKYDPSALVGLTSSEQRKKKREMKMQNSPTEVLAYNAKVIWEDVRNEKLKHSRADNVAKLLSVVEGSMKLITMRRDTSRVLQSILKHGSEEQKAVLFNELKDHILDLSKNNYGHFIVLKMLKYGTKAQRAETLKAFNGKVRKLSTHHAASTVLEYAFTTVCTKEQQNSFTQEFYGPEFALFKDQKVEFEQILEQNSAKKSAVLKYLFDLISALASKPNALDNSIVHLPIYNYLSNATAGGKSSAIPLLAEHVVRFLHTKPGAKAVALCIKYGTPKDRKTIAKACKPYLEKIVQEEFGHLVFLELLASVDDTVLIKKELLTSTSFESNIFNFCLDKYGHLSILALISQPTQKHFPQSTLALLEPGFIPDPADPTKQTATSKKSRELKQAENYLSIQTQLVKVLLENTYELLTDPSDYGRTVALSFLTTANDEANIATVCKQILKWVDFDAEAFLQAELKESNSDRKYHPLEQQPEGPQLKQDLMTHPRAHRTLKLLVKECEAFGALLYEHIQARITTYTEDENAAWVILSLVQHKEIGSQISKILSKHTFAKPESPVSKLILEKLNK